MVGTPRGLFDYSSITLPETLNVAMIEDLNPNHQRKHPSWTQKALWFLSSLTGLQEDEDSPAAERGSRSFHSSRLSRALGGDFRAKIIDPLIGAGIVEVCGFTMEKEGKETFVEGYFPSVSSKRYRLTEEYRKTPAAFFEYDVQRIAAKYHRSAGEPLKALTKGFDEEETTSADLTPLRTKEVLSPELHHLVVLRSCLSISFPRWAREFLSGPFKETEPSVNRYSRALAAYSTFESILARSPGGPSEPFPFDFNFRNAHHRLFYPVVNTPKPLRALMLLEGEPVVEVDVSCSQPFCAACVLYPLIQNSPTKQEERQRFIDAVTGGTFYSGLEQRRRETGGAPEEGDLKAAVLRQVFTGKPYFDNRPLWNAFESLYPLLAGKLRSLREPKEGEKAYTTKQHLGVSHALAKEESRLIFGAVSRIHRKRPSVPLCTIHDAIMCRKSDSEFIRDEILDHYEEQVGLRPRLIIKNPREDAEYLTPEQREAILRLSKASL